MKTLAISSSPHKSGNSDVLSDDFLKETAENSGGQKMKKLLIVYYSWSNGNTERIAKTLQRAAGGDLLRIDTAVPYAGSYDDVVEQGQREVK